MPYPHPEPLSLRQTTADPYLHRRCSNRVLSQSLWVPGSWSTQRLFEPSENLWQEWDLILNVNSPPPPPPSCWGFSFALGCGVSPYCWSSAYHLTGVFLTLDVGCLHTAGPAECRHHSWLWIWGISSRLLLLTLDVGYLLSAAPAPRIHHLLLQLTILIPYWSYTLQIFSPIQ